MPTSKFKPRVLPDAHVGSAHASAWLYIDRSGKTLATADNSGEFHEGFALVHDHAIDKCYYMNTKGRRAFNGKLFDSRGGDFSEGVAAVKKGDTWGYIDKTGNFVIRPQFLTATQFSERVAAVESPNHKWHYINHDGRAAFNEQFDGWCVPFKAGIAWFEDKAGHCHFIDRNGKALFVLDNKYAFVHYPITGDRILVKYRAALPNPNFPPKDSED